MKYQVMWSQQSSRLKYRMRIIRQEEAFWLMSSPKDYMDWCYTQLLEETWLRSEGYSETSFRDNLSIT